MNTGKKLEQTSLRTLVTAAFLAEAALAFSLAARRACSRWCLRNSGFSCCFFRISSRLSDYKENKGASANGNGIGHDAATQNPPTITIAAITEQEPGIRHKPGRYVRRRRAGT